MAPATGKSILPIDNGDQLVYGRAGARAYPISGPMSTRYKKENYSAFGPIDNLDRPCYIHSVNAIPR